MTNQPTPITQPAATDDIHLFLSTLNLAVRNPLTADAVRMFAALAARVFADMPPRVWNQTVLLDACRRFDFFPSIADLNKLFREHEQSTLAHLALAKLPQAKEAKGYLPPPPPQWAVNQAPRFRIVPHDFRVDAPRPAIPQRSPAQQYAQLLGISVDEAELRLARKVLDGQKRADPNAA